jgi:polyhydroxyalkanoate synthesis regulator phasin
VSEERNQIREERSPNMGNFENWESQLQARANEMFARRIAPLKAEIERLQGAISEIGSRLTGQDGGITGEESSGLIEEIKRWFDESTAKVEENFKSRLEEAAANARREAEIQIEELREQLEASRALTTAVASSQSASRSFETFKAAIEDIDSQRTQSDILAALVRHAAEFAPRVAFFVIKSGDVVGWKASGFDNGLNDETVKLLIMPAQKPSLLRDALTSLRLAASAPQSDGDGVSEVLGVYGSPAPERAIAIPLIVLNKAVAVLYADSGAQPADSLNAEAAESLTRIAGRTIEHMLSRRGADPARQRTSGAAETLHATPLRTDGKAMGAAIQQTPSQLTVQSAVQMESVRATVEMEGLRAEPDLKQDYAREPHREIPEDAPQIEKADETAGASSDRVTIERRRTQELPLAFDKNSIVDDTLRQAEAQLPEPAYIETEPGATSGRLSGAREVSETAVGISGRLRVESPASEPSPSPSEIEEQPAFSETVAAASPAPLPDFAASPAGEPPVPSDIQPFSPPPAPPVFTPSTKTSKSAQLAGSIPGSETEQRAHNDARRFARLLVSEIKLYNAAKVNDGRRNYDLYERLKDEIDRSRKVYDKRVSPAVAARFDYFYDELVQTLAEGDPAKLGKDCPGPVALA